MRVTVCQLPDEPRELEPAWRGLGVHVADAGTELLVLPEMGFSPWLPASRQVDPERWAAAVRIQQAWCDRLGELGIEAAVGSRPVDRPEPRNRAFLWSNTEGWRDLHDKAYLPDEPGFWEASWYHRGEPAYETVAVPRRHAPTARLGTLLCTEMWFLEHARAHGRDGAHLLAVPRATPASTLDKWIAGGRTAAVVAGAYCLSSVPCSVPGSDADLGGGGWIIDPDGEVVALTDPSKPFQTLDLDLDAAEAAKSTYPRYVPEAAPSER